MQTLGFEDLRWIIILFLWISSWSIIDLTITEFIKSYKFKMLVYFVMLAIAILFYVLYYDSQAN